MGSALGAVFGEDEPKSGGTKHEHHEDDDRQLHGGCSFPGGASTSDAYDEDEGGEEGEYGADDAFDEQHLTAFWEVGIENAKRKSCFSDISTPCRRQSWKYRET